MSTMRSINESQEHIRGELHAALGAAGLDYSPAAADALALLLADAMASRVDRAEVEERIARDPRLHELAWALAGKQLGFGTALVEFGAGSQLGDVTIGDIAGRDVVKINVIVPQQITSPRQFYDVRGLPNPYPGMKTLEQEQQALLVGRDTEIKEAIKHLTSPGEEKALCFITGVSGSGKSSFAYAGLVPALETRYGEDAQTLWGRKTVRRAHFRPSSQPIYALLIALRTLGLPTQELAANQLVVEPQRLLSFLREHTPPEQVNVLVIDQFEELFNEADPEQRNALLAMLSGLQAVTSPNLAAVRTHVIITLRVDYTGRLFDEKSLYKELKQAVELRALQKEALLELIVAPLRGTSKQFQPELLEQLLNDAGQHAGCLPLLQGTLRALWNSGWLELANYTSLTATINAEANQIYSYTGPGGSPRSKEEQSAIIDMMLRMVKVSAEDPSRYSRRQRSYAQLTDGDPKRRQLCEQLIAGRLLVASRGRNSEEVMVDIIHEALITSWDTLNQAVVSEYSNLLNRERFEAAVAEWREKGESPTLLLTGLRLAEAGALAARNDTCMRGEAAQAFFNQSKRQAELVQRRADIVRLVGGVAGAGLGYSLGFTVLLGVSQLFDPNRMIFLSELPQYALLSALYMFSVGTLVGLALSLALWLAPGRVARDAVAGVLETTTKPTTWPRWVVTMLAGATFSALGIMLFLFGPLQQQSPPVHPIVAGALTGALLGAAVAQEQRRRVGTLTLAGSIGLWIFAVINNLFFDDGTKVSLLEAMMATGRGLNPFAGLLGGAILGALMGLGFYVADAVDRMPS